MSRAFPRDSNWFGDDLTAQKVGRNDICPCGSGKKYKHCCQLGEARTAKPAPLGALAAKQLMDGFALFQARRFDEAAGVCAQVLRSHPMQADALHLKGLIYQGLGSLSEALEQIDLALSIGANFSMHSSRGLVLQALRRHAEAADSYRTALAGQPHAPLLHCNLGASLVSLRRWDEALASYRQAFVLDANNAVALNGIGYCLQMLGDLAGAESQLRQALAVDSRYGLAIANLGNVLWARGELDTALDTYRKATDLEPQNPQAWENLGEALLQQCRMAEARECFDQAIRCQPSIERRIRRDLMLPYIYESRQQMLQCRATFEAHIDAMLRESLPLLEVTPSAALYCSSIFKLAFQGMDDLPLMRKLADLYRHICPALNYQAAHVNRQVTLGSKVRVGFFSTKTQDHSVSRCFSELIARLATDTRLEIVLLSTRDPSDSQGPNLYSEFTGKFVLVDSQYRAARDVIEAQELDVLVYQDIGMEDTSYFLAFARLARYQCVIGGHPVTTGLSTMDFYISSALAESADAQSHYAEELFLVGTSPTVFVHPPVPSAAKERDAFGLPPDGALYVCPMMLQKIHPDFDAAVARILELDPDGHVVFFEHANAHWQDILKARFESSISEPLRSRIVFLPWLQDYADFITVNALASVVLDPFHFGIGSTAIATFAVCTPIVTLPGSYLRGRVGLSWCKLMDLPECIALDPEDYAVRAVALAHDIALRQKVSGKIAANKPRFFDNYEPVHELAAFFVRLGASAHSRAIAA